MTLRWRPAEPGDVPMLRDIEATLFPDSPWSEETLAMELAMPGRCYLVLEEDERPIGYGGIWLAPTAEVMTIGVLPHVQGRGLGRQLLEALLVQAVTAGCREVFLEVRVDNEPAIRLYRSMGFQSVRIRPRYYQPADVDALVMRLPLEAEGAEPGPEGP